MPEERQSLELLAQDSNVRGSHRELEIKRSSGNTWKNGSLLRREDGTVKFVSPLESLSVPHRLTEVPPRGRAGPDR